MGQTTAVSHDTTDDEAACMHALSLLSGFVAPMTLKAVIELGLIDELLAADGQAVTPEELVAAGRWPRPAEAAAAVDRMLRFLATHSVVRCTTEVGPDGKDRRSYAATPVCKWLTTRNGGQGSMAPLWMMNLDKAFMETWYYMKDAVTEGVTPTEKAYGMPLFEHLESNEASSVLFNQAMGGHSEIITKKLLERYRGFEGIDGLVDVGGGTGVTLRMITAQHKDMRGVNYDLPHVIAQAPPIQGKLLGESYTVCIFTINPTPLWWMPHIPFC
ncbi:Naringenin 7-O-methyltransferase [Dichanthelium oligosanthes]|uniref:Naringenin 7-O-methyltransferase n=1 Tax=Dichanthelium oligosanthes TaxID=888268 RepID=A0A1E5UN84_9POAL|nr:Naringenin 7-O-methyltransferase [Dichanthelium oligosanthes]